MAATPSTQHQSQTLPYDPSRLHAALISVLHAGRTNVLRTPVEDVVGAQTQQLFEELMLSKPHLLRLFDVGPRNDQEKKEVEGGKYSLIAMADSLTSFPLVRC